MTLDQFIEILPRYTLGSFATSVNNKTYIRGWQYQFAEKGKFYFVTTKGKKTYAQLLENPYASYFAIVDGQSFDISGEVTFVKDKKEKERIFSQIDPTLQEMTPNVDDFEYFFISNGEVRYSASFISAFDSIKI